LVKNINQDKGRGYLSLNEQTIVALEELGLGKVQARIYNVLANLGVSNARVLAKNAKVATQDVYRILNELIDIGLVIKKISRPIQYVPLPLHEGLSLLLKRKKKTFDILEKTVSKLAKSNMNSEFSPAMIGGFLFVPAKEPIDKIVIKMFETAESGVDLMNDKKDICYSARAKFSNCMCNALNRGIIIREIIFSQEDSVLPIEDSEVLNNNKNYNQKQIKMATPAIMVIKDKKELFIATSTKILANSQPFLWTNNPILVNIVQEWYNNIWDQNGNIMIGLAEYLYSE
jgi:sugar-specific transcriptional regulator TrmB